MIVITPIPITGEGATRASTATYANSTGQIASAAVNALRISYDPLALTDPPVALVETTAATNLLLNSAIAGTNLATQSVTVTAVPHTLSFYGTGTVTLSGASTAGPAVGAGAYPARRTLTFTPAAGSLTLTVTGTVQYAQLETGSRASSFIPTAGAPATRAADVLGTSTLLYSNVLENEYPAHSMGTAYAISDRVIYQHNIYQAVQAGTGHLPTDTAWWVFVSATNQRKMFDDLNNTATQNADVIRVVLQPRAVAGGLYLGGVSAFDVRATMVDGLGNKVYSMTESMIQQTTGVSYYTWMFSRITRRNAVIKVDLPAYYDGVLLVEIRNPGATAATAMLSIGPADPIGITDYGVSRDITDYSSDTFTADGTSTTILRGYSKGMDLDITIDNNDIDAVVDAVENYRQKSVVWIASQNFKHTVVFGKYASFKTVIASYPDSRMSLSIKGRI